VRKILDGLFVPNLLQTFARNNFSVETEAQLAQPVAKPVQKAVRFEQPQAIVPAVSTPRDSLSMDDIVTRLDQLTISNAELKSLIESTARTAAAPGGGQSRPTTPDQTKRCIVCGQMAGQGGTHRLGWKNCPTTYELFKENLVSTDNNGRLLATDGSEIPSAFREPGGIAQLLRGRRDAAAGGNTAAVVAQFEGHNALGGSVLAVSADDENMYFTDPALRSGRDTSTRHDPYARPNQAKGKETASKPPT
jgi:hypothetical protein